MNAKKGTFQPFLERCNCISFQSSSSALQDTTTISHTVVQQGPEGKRTEEE